MDVNSAEGKGLVAKYNITAVPTVILIGDTFAYGAVLNNIWPSVGIKSDDGAYVFTKVDLAQKPYKNLQTGEVITPVQDTNENA